MGMQALNYCFAYLLPGEVYIILTFWYYNFSSYQKRY